MKKFLGCVLWYVLVTGLPVFVAFQAMIASANLAAHYWRAEEQVSKWEKLASTQQEVISILIVPWGKVSR